jgi:chromosome partitioning protein
MPRILAVVNQKGGVGKTTTAVNLAAALAQAGRRVLLVDVDRKHATMGGGGTSARSRYRLPCASGSASSRASACAPSAAATISYRRTATLPGRGGAGRAAGTRDAAQIGARARRGQYDYILIDCPPSLSLLTVNALTAAQPVLIPMQCEYYALEGLSDLVGTIKRVRANLNPALEIEGLLRTMYDPRNTLSLQVSRELEAHFGDKVFRTLVPRNVRLAEAPSYGVPAVIWDPSSKGAQAYAALAAEVLEREVAYS